MKKIFFLIAFLLTFSGLEQATANDIDTVWMRWMPPNHSVSSVRFSPDNNKIAAFSTQNNAVAIVNVSDGSIDTVLGGFKWGEYSPDGQYIYSTYANKIIRINTSDYSYTTLFDSAMGGLASISLADNGFAVCRIGNGFQVWNLNTGLIIFSKQYQGITPDTNYGQYLFQIKFLKNGQYLLASIDDEYKDMKGDLHTFKSYTLIISTENYTVLDTLFDTEYFYSSNSSRFMAGQYVKTNSHEDISINVYDLQQNQIILSIPGYYSIIPDIAFSPDDKYLAVAYSILGKIEIWNLALKQTKYIYQPGGYSAVDITSDNKYLVGGISNLLALWPFDTKVNTIDNLLIFATITYPNPTHDIFNIEFDLMQNNQTTIDMVALNGQTVKSIDNNYLSTGHYFYQVDISDLPAGAYTLRINSGNFSYQTNIIKD